MLNRKSLGCVLWLVSGLAAAGCGEGMISGPAPSDVRGSSGSDAEGTLEADLASAKFDIHNLLSDADISGGAHITVDQVQEFLDRQGSLLARYFDPAWDQTAAQLIVERSQAHGINPLYMIARIQTESALITRGTEEALLKATGCGCPDSSPCQKEYEGFGNQIECGARKIRGYFDDLDAGSTTVSGWMPGSRKATSDPCDILPANKATAALYTYTPWVGAYGSQCGRADVGGSTLVAKLYAQFRLAFDWDATLPTSPAPDDSDDTPVTVAGKQCHSGTVGRFVDPHACVQSASDGVWRQCRDGTFFDYVEGDSPACSKSYGWCRSETLGRDVPMRTCVQARSNGEWYQCGTGGVFIPAAMSRYTGAGPEGACAEQHAL